MTDSNEPGLLDEFGQGRMVAIGWGCGEVFNAMRDTLHTFPLAGTIHNSAAMQGRYVRGVKVLAPTVLDNADPAVTVVICYSRDFRDEISRHCARFPGLRVIDWSDRRLIDRDQPARLAHGIALVRQQGLLSITQARQIARTCAASQGATADFGGLGPALREGYDLMAQFRRDVYNALTKQVHFMHLMQMPGHIAEFGTASGMTARFLAAAMADASAYRGDRRQLHLFDSFQGLPQITHPLDVEAGWREGDFKDKTAAQLGAICREYIDDDQVRLYEGWYKDTLSSIPAGAEFGLVHIDCDTYESTTQVLQYLFAKGHIADGCAILFDDWNCSQASPRLGERRAWAEVVERFGITFSDCGDYSVFGHKVLVHR